MLQKTKKSRKFLQLHGVTGVLWQWSSINKSNLTPSEPYPFLDQTSRIQAIFLGENGLMILTPGTIYRQKKGS